MEKRKSYLPEDEKTITLAREIHVCLKKWNQAETINLSLLQHPAIPQIEKGMQQLESGNPFFADLLHRRFIKEETILYVAHHFNLSPDQINRRQREAINELSQIVNSQTNRFLSTQSKRLMASIPPARYDKLFGQRDYHDNLLPLLLRNEAPWIFSITGLGGIGKSALANSLLQELSNSSSFTRFLWIRIERENLREATSKALRELVIEKIVLATSSKILPSEEWPEFISQDFANNPTLLVLDGLGSEPIGDNLFNELRKFTSPSKVIITSRAKIPATEEVFQLAMQELGESPALRFMLHHAKSINLDHEAKELQEITPAIYKVTGGNPLAIRLALGLLFSYPLDQVLNLLSDSPDNDVEMVYRFIYQQSWEALSKKAKQLLQAMPLAAEEGASWEHLEALSGQENPKITGIVKELSSRSLLELRGSLEAPRYGIHRLTDSFIRTDILKWM